MRDDDPIAHLGKSGVAVAAFDVGTGLRRTPVMCDILLLKQFALNQSEGGKGGEVGAAVGEDRRPDAFTTVAEVHEAHQ